jgi:hypothetical protein
MYFNYQYFTVVFLMNVFYIDIFTHEFQDFIKNKILRIIT